MLSLWIFDLEVTSFVLTCSICFKLGWHEKQSGSIRNTANTDHALMHSLRMHTACSYVSKCKLGGCTWSWGRHTNKTWCQLCSFSLKNTLVIQLSISNLLAVFPISLQPWYSHSTIFLIPVFSVSKEGGYCFMGGYHLDEWYWEMHGTSYELLTAGI